MNHGLATLRECGRDLYGQAARCDDLTEYSANVLRVEEETDGRKLSVLVERVHQVGTDGTEIKTEEWISGVDLLVAADGRYSAIRQQLVPPVPYFGPPYVADFRIVAKLDPHDVEKKALVDKLLPAGVPLWRIYHRPRSKLLDNPTLSAAACGYVRVGLMRLEEFSLGMFGNVRMKNKEKLDDEAKTADALIKLFTPEEDESPHEYGELLLQILKDNGDNAHWTRKQETDTCYEALKGRVLSIGDVQEMQEPFIHLLGRVPICRWRMPQ